MGQRYCWPGGGGGGRPPATPRRGENPEVTTKPARTKAFSRSDRPSRAGVTRGDMSGRVGEEGVQIVRGVATERTDRRAARRLARSVCALFVALAETTTHH